ncbi:MAG: cell wall-binding repeat-containing protein [Coriobacteriia bacterium]|nr:cell wall-binding repeat-containing protein [Coriobacteriia bacterium]
MKSSAARPGRVITVTTLALVIVLVSATPAFAMSRNLVMARAQQWAGCVIPYSQTGWANEIGEIVESSLLGWRRDCSGFTSMGWNLPKPGASTRTLQYYGTLITKEALQPGDAMVSYNNHAVVFGGWADPQRYSYYAYEMSSSESSKTGDGTVVRVTPYPYWGYNTAFKPYRLKGITGNIDYSAYTTPVAGANRYETALAASRIAFGDGEADSVVIASGTNWPDALGAAALAGVANGPILLCAPTYLSVELTREIKRLGASEIIVVGGAGAVSDGVFTTLSALPSVETTRIGGATRYDTARLIATETVRRIEAGGGSFDGTAFIATGENFPDALAASAFAANTGRPILLTTPAELSTEASSAMSELGVSRAIILGGEGAIASQVTSDLASSIGEENVVRLGGINRYATAQAIIDYCLPESSLGFVGMAIASGQGFPDALAGGVMAARMGTFLGLTPTSYLHPGVAQLLLDNAAEVRSAHVLGGEGVIPPIVRESIALALGGV